SFNWEDISCISNVIIRIMLFIFPFIRLSCALIFLTFLIRNSYIVIFLGCYASFFEMLPVKNRYLFSTTNLSLLMNFKDGVITAISVKQALLTITVSLIASVIYLGLGYIVFKKRDMR
nr:hypothetical protein [Lachnospiraceae bacterium]